MFNLNFLAGDWTQNASTAAFEVRVLVCAQAQHQYGLVGVYNAAGEPAQDYDCRTDILDEDGAENFYLTVMAAEPFDGSVAVVQGDAIVPNEQGVEA